MSITGLGEVASLATDVINKFFPDKSQQEKDNLALQMQVLLMQSQEKQGQMSVNKAEASSASIFVAGWRPFIGWVCGCSFAWTFVVGPMLAYFVGLLGRPVVLPVLDLSQLSPVLMGMLGLGVMRTVEKVRGLTPGH